MKKIFSFFVLFILANLAANAQYDPLFSNYMFASNVANPSVVGLTNSVNAVFMTRNMFTGFGEGNPVTSVFGAEMPLSLFGSSGFGVLITNDAIGFQDEVSVDFSYSYHRRLKSGNRLSFGATVGFNDYHIAPNWTDELNEEGLWASSSSDDGVPDEHSFFSVDLAAGFRYETSRYYLSLSVNHLNQASIREETESNIVEGNEYSYYARHFYLNGGYNIELPDPLFEIRPTFMLRTNLSAYVLDMNGTMYYKDKYRAGAGLRVSPFNIAAIMFTGGVELANGLVLNYALDINTTAMFVFAPTSHEVMVTYSFNLETKRNQKYKSIRYL